MTLKLSQLRTHFTPDEAYLIISFLNEISDTLWAVYGADIIEQQQHCQQTDDQDDQDDDLNQDIF